MQPDISNDRMELKNHETFNQKYFGQFTYMAAAIWTKDMKKITPIALILAVVAYATLATNSHAQELYAHFKDMYIYDTSEFNDFNTITLKEIVPLTVPFGIGINTDSSGNLYALANFGLNIYDPDLNFIGRAEANDPISNQLRQIAVRPGQAFSCNPTHIPRLFVFDTHDLQNPFLSRVVVVPQLTSGVCQSVEFDSAGDLWVTTKTALVRLGLDPDGNPIESELFSSRVFAANPGGFDFQPGTGYVFIGAINDNRIIVLDRTVPGGVVIATINDICNPNVVVFSRSGDLFVSCSSTTNDFVAFPSNALQNLSGSVAASALSQVGFDEPTLIGGFLAIKEIVDPLILLEALINKVIDLNLQKGITNSLDVKLEAVIQALEDLNQNNNAAALGALLAFVSAVEAQRGNQIPEADADALIADAQIIIDLVLAE